VVLLRVPVAGLVLVLVLVIAVLQRMMDVLVKVLLVVWVPVLACGYVRVWVLVPV
jgi:hypothetical protein